MRVVLMLLIVMMTASDVLGIDMNLGMGLSAKNILLNVVACALVFRMIVRGNFRLEAPAVVAGFGITFLYALLTTFLADMVIQYPHYDLKGSIVALKDLVLDPALFFLTFLYATRTQSDVKIILRTLLVCMAVANVLTITNVYGITDIGHMAYGLGGYIEGNRVYGFFGHANETGVLIVVLLPAYIASISSSRGFWRLVMGGGMLTSLVVLIMTGSRGAIAGFLLGGIWGVILCRNYISPGRIFRGAAKYLAVGLPVVAIFGAKYGLELVQRVLGQSSSADMGDVSSGRTLLWGDALGRMMETPLTLITGFGWNVYESMGYFLIPHNHYIALWFALGLIGLGCFFVIIRTLVVNLLAAARTADWETRQLLIAAVFATLILLVGIFVEQLFKPWYYIWPYLAIALRSALLVRAEARATVAAIPLRSLDLRREPRAGELDSAVRRRPV